MFHVLNRSVARLRINRAARDYVAFARVPAEVQAYRPMRVLSRRETPHRRHLAPRGSHVVRWRRADAYRWIGPCRAVSGRG